MYAHSARLYKVKPKREPTWLRLSFPQRFSLAFLGQKPSSFRNPLRGRRRLSVYSNGVISPDAGPGGSSPWWGSGAHSPSVTSCWILVLHNKAVNRYKKSACPPMHHDDSYLFMEKTMEGAQSLAILFGFVYNANCTKTVLDMHSRGGAVCKKRTPAENRPIGGLI